MNWLDKLDAPSKVMVVGLALLSTCVLVVLGISFSTGDLSPGWDSRISHLDAGRTLPIVDAGGLHD